MLGYNIVSLDIIQPDNAKPIKICLLNAVLESQMANVFIATDFFLQSREIEKEPLHPIRKWLALWTI